MWLSKSARVHSDSNSDSNSDSKEPFQVYSKGNHIHFNGDICDKSAFALNRELRNVETELVTEAVLNDEKRRPIYLHITSDGGLIYCAWSIVDCLRSLRVDVYSVVDGSVASAATLITLAARRRYMQPNAYLLIHELSGTVNGRYSAIGCEVLNLKEYMKHIKDFYLDNTDLESDELDIILLKDVSWNAGQCLRRGLCDAIY